ncbi:MAG TPA: PQQ-dependent sugar dehydrogenase [Gemmatimonadaceae bacterium]|jgi:glucose/arabinose dehydrogenase|nr:PQQ-dependent sugar dehydrogenase [Gemmatimonadaceae bacterium]
MSTGLRIVAGVGAAAALLGAWVTMRHRRVPGDELHAPPGFQVTTFAHVSGARFMAVGPDGAVYVSEPDLGQVVRLVDTGRGVADSVTVFASGLDGPHGLAFHGGALYIAGHTGVVRIAGGTHTVLNHYTGGGGHTTRTIVFGGPPDSAMYVSIGSSCNLCVEKDSDRAVVMRYDTDGSHGRVFARGLRNAVGLAISPATGALWATVNERDNIEPNHENLPPDRLDIVTDSGDYGWPYCYGNHVPNPEYHDPVRCQRETPPVLGFQAHSAPLGLTFYRGDILVAFHGSWNRRIPTGAKVVRVRLDGGKPVGYDDFITGWQRNNGSRWGRPVDVIVARDGSVLVSDDAAGAIYRVTGS